MKKSNRTLLLGRAFLVVLFIGGMMLSCSKDKEDDKGISRADFKRSFFDIQNGEFNSRGLPSSNSSTLNISSINGNSTVLAGGTNLIHIAASEGATHVIVGVQDEKGHFQVPMAPSRAQSRGEMAVEVSLQLLIGQQIEDGFTIAFAVADDQGNISSYHYLPITLLSAGTGVLQVSLSWDQLNDVDLHLIEPNGHEIYYGSPYSANGGQLDVDSNPACYIDNINNENIYYDEDATIEYGEYEVLVDLWSNCNVPNNTNYSIIVHYGGEVIATTEGTNPHVGELTPDDESGNTNPISVMKFVIDGPAPKGLANYELQNAPKAFKFNFDKNNKVFQNFGVHKD